MKLLKKYLLWLWLLTKRLYKKATFLAILALIPIVVLGYRAMTAEESGIITVALAQQGSDRQVCAIFNDLTGSNQLVRYVICDDTQQAQTMVQTGKADAAWLFCDDFIARVDAFVADPTSRNALVTVLEREDSTTLMLTREKLSGVLYEQVTQRLYLSHTRQENPSLPEMTDEEMLQYYHDAQATDALFNYQETEKVDEGHYLLTPIRGLLAVVICLCGLAAAMYHTQDLAAGTFGYVPQKRRILPELGCQLTAVGNVAVVSFLALLLSGLSKGFFRELGVLVLYCLCVSFFCMLLRRLLGGIRGLGTALPVLVVLMLLVCPVFVDFAIFRQLQLLLPPTFFVQSLYQPVYVLYMLLHSAICAGMCLLLDALKTK